MIIAIPTNNGKTVSKHVSLSKYITKIEVQNGEIIDRILVENPIPGMIKKSEGSTEGARGLGAGRIIPEIVGNADVFVAREIGEGMKRNLTYAGIKVVTTDKSSIEEIINEFKGGA